MRLDQYLVSKQMFATRTRAQDGIQEGLVFVNEVPITKNSYDIGEEDVVRVEQAQLVLASRAGYKLYDVLEPFAISLQNRICIDVGASTGGFSDVCLQAGASMVYAVDVGKDQLLQRLKEDERIVNLEGVNCRYITSDMFHPQPDFACMDVSFISIKNILPALCDIVRTKEMVILIKPQFEAGSANVGKHGIVKNEKVHIQVLHDIVEFVSSLGLFVHHLCASSLLGRDGNKEFVMHIKEEPCHKVFPIKQIVKEYSKKR